MNRSYTIVSIVLLIVMLACSGADEISFSTANVSDATLARDEAGDDPTTIFEQDDNFFLVIDLNNAPDSTELKAVWTAVDADGLDADFVLEETVATGGDISNFSLTNDSLWPIGDYKVDLYLDGELNQSLTFAVEGDVLAEGPADEPAPTATPKPPTATPTEEPEEVEADPTATPETSTGDSLAGSGGSSSGDSLGSGSVSSSDEVIFSDTFSSNENGWELGEFETEFTIDEVDISRGKYQITVTSLQAGYVERTLPDQIFSDFTLSVEATPDDSETAYAYGVAFRVADDGRGYTFEINNNGVYNVSLFDGEWQPLVEWTASDAINIGEMNELGVTAVGGKLSFSVNDEVLTTIEDETVEEGQIGLVVDMFEADQIAFVEFDNLTISEPADSAISDSLAGAGVNDEDVVFQSYTHPSDAFQFDLPEDWTSINEDETSAAFATLDGTSFVGAVFVDAGVQYETEEIEAFIDSFIKSFIESFGESYEVVLQEDQPDGSVYVGTAYEGEDGNGDADFFFEQRDTVLFVLYFVSENYTEMNPIWTTIIESYGVDPNAAILAAPAEVTPTPRPLPTATPAPAANPFAPPPGGARVYLVNEYANEFNIDFGDGSGSIQVPPGADNFYHDVAPGSYNPGLSLPGAGAANVQFDIQANQSWIIIVTADAGIRSGQVYP